MLQTSPRVLEAAIQSKTGNEPPAGKRHPSVAIHANQLTVGADHFLRSVEANQMTGTGYIFLACLFVVLAIMVRLLWLHDAAWIGKDLQRGDLLTLAQVVNGKRYGVGRDRLLRLSGRGFVFEDAYGGCRMTLKGRYAAYLMRSRPAFVRETTPSDGSRGEPRHPPRSTA